MRGIYFDNNATTRPLPEVLDVMTACLTDGFGNASAVYRRGREARERIEAARASVARLLGASPSEIIFTSGGTESDNTALFGLCGPGDHLVTTAIEHDAILSCLRPLAERPVSVTLVRPAPSGRIDPEDVRRALTPQTRLISVMTANNETGVLQPIEDIGRIAAETGVWFHTDAVQAAGKIAIDVGRMGCHLLSLSAHKIHGPQGIGALYIKRGSPVRPLVLGGHQERGRRAGTENLAGIAGFGRAADAARDGLSDGAVARIAEWRLRVERELCAHIDGLVINGGDVPRVCNTLNLTIDGVPADALMAALDRRGISISAGSACRSGSKAPSHVLRAMGLSPRQARCSVRISLGKLNSGEEIDYFLSIFAETVRCLRKDPRSTTI